MHLTRKQLWIATGYGAAMAGGVLARVILKSGWKAAAHEEPPNNPAEPGVTWTRALLWGALTGAAAGMTRVVARRMAVEGWRGTTGREPPLESH